MVLELGLCKQDKTYVKTFFSIGWRNLISLPLKQRRHFGPFLWVHGSHKPTPRQWWCTNSSPMRCVPTPRQWGVSQLLANHECTNSSPMMVCQFLSNELCASFLLMRCVSTPRQSWVCQLLANDGVPISLQWGVCQLLDIEVCANSSPMRCVPTPRQWSVS